MSPPDFVTLEGVGVEAGVGPESSIEVIISRVRSRAAQHGLTW